MRNMALMVSLLMGVGACRSDAPTSSAPVSAQVTAENIPVDELQWSAAYATANLAFTDRSTASTGAALWRGESSVNTTAPKTCPLTAPNLRAYKDGEWYGATGIWTRSWQVDPGATFPNLPHYFFEPPYGATVINDAKTRRFVGEFVLACDGHEAVTSRGAAVWVGKVYTVGTSGYTEPIGSTGGYKQHRGWGYSGTVTGGNNGAGYGWQTALSNYLTYGTCSSGYDIYVDGVKRCNSLV
jgi:hypothetical protein